MTFLVVVDLPMAQEDTEVAINSDFDYDVIDDIGLLHRDDQPTSPVPALSKQKVETRYFDYTPDKLDYHSLASLSTLTTAAIEDQFTSEFILNSDGTAPLFDQARPFLESFELYTLPEVAESTNQSLSTTS